MIYRSGLTVPSGPFPVVWRDLEGSGQVWRVLDKGLEESGGSGGVWKGLERGLEVWLQGLEGSG